MRLPGFATVGTYSIPAYLLAPTQMIQVFHSCLAHGDTPLQALTQKIIGVCRYLEGTTKLNFERCLRGEEF